jgi:hypothetical protein
MVGQLVVVVLLVAAAACYVALATWRSVRGSKSGCGGNCGCATKAASGSEIRDKPTLISVDDLAAGLRNRARS